MVPLLRTAIIVAPILLAIAPARAQDARRTTAGPEPAYALVTTSAKHVRDELTFEVVAPDVRAKEWVVYITRLPELTSQTDVRSALSPGGRPRASSAPWAGPSCSRGFRSGGPRGATE